MKLFTSSLIHLQESVAIVIHYYLSYPLCFLYDCAESVQWVITTAKRLIKSAYSYRIKYYRPIYTRYYRPIYGPRCGPIYPPIYLVEYRYTIGEASVKYRWGIGERQLYRPIGVSVDTQQIYRPTLNRASSATQLILDRYLVECRSRYRPIYRPILRWHGPIGYMIRPSLGLPFHSNYRSSSCQRY